MSSRYHEKVFESLDKNRNIPADDALPFDGPQVRYYTPRPRVSFITPSDALATLPPIDLAFDLPITTIISRAYCPVTNPPVSTIRVEIPAGWFCWNIQVKASTPLRGVTVWDLYVALHRSMHCLLTESEWAMLEESGQRAVGNARSRGRRVVPVSTRSCSLHRIDVLGGETFCKFEPLMEDESLTLVVNFIKVRLVSGW